MDNGAPGTANDQPSADGSPGRDVLVIVAATAALVAALIIAADPFGLEAGRGRDLALGALGLAFVAVGLVALVALLDAISANDLARLTAFVSVVAVVCLVGALGVVMAAVLAADPVGPGGDQVLDETVGADAEEPAEEHGPLPVAEPMSVFLQLTPTGRQDVADAMGCTTRDLQPGAVQAVAVGGTLASPIVNIRIVDDFGELSAACRAIRVRIPANEVVVIPATL